MGRRWLGESLSNVTQKSRGMSLAEGILYVPAKDAKQHLEYLWVTKYNRHAQICCAISRTVCTYTLIL